MKLVIEKIGLKEEERTKTITEEVESSLMS